MSANTASLQQLYITYFNRPADTVGLQYWEGQMAAGVKLATVQNGFSSSPEYQAIYKGETTESLINKLYLNLFAREADPAGLVYWAGKVADGTYTINTVASAISSSAKPGSADYIAITNKITAATSYTTGMITTDAIIAYTNAPAFAVASAWLAPVKDTSTLATASTSLTSTIAEATAAGTSSSQSFMLTTGLDNMIGTSAADEFTALVVQNANGEQTNQLATGDQLTGGANVDTLNATVQMASALNGSPNQAITPITTGVEEALFTALTINNTAALGTNETVVINAKSMKGLTLVGSDQSDASLTIQNLTTLQNDGVYAARRNTETVTIRMDHTGNDAALDAASDLTVLFDNDYLRSDANSQSRALYFVLDEKAELARLNGDAAMPRLNAINVDGLRFSVTTNGVTKSIDLSDKVSWDANKMDTHADFVAALQDELAALIAKGDLPAGTTLTLDSSVTDITYLDNGQASDKIPAIVLTVTGNSSVIPTGYHQVADELGSYNVYGEFRNDSATSETPIIATIELEKVGRGAEGGDLTVGGMATDLKNVFDYSDSAIKEGVDLFNITVSGDQTQFSSLASLQSTNNTLKTVNVKWATGSVADLIIGNSNTAGDAPNGSSSSDDDVSSAYNNALKDVRDFTAADNNSASVNGKVVTNDVTVYASVTDESVAKYMALTDNGLTPANDNANFVYSFGSGNDLLNINISKTNLAQSGTTNREDFSFTANMGDGNDTIETQIGDGKGVASDAWFINSKLDNNLGINAGAGNDTVRTFGAGNWTVDLGAGNDVIYSDNSGNQFNTTTSDYNSGRAVWVFNTADQVSVPVVDSAERNINDLVSDANGEHALYNGTLTIDLDGVKATVVINDYNTTDLELNNLIKAAIQSDVYLSKLIVAEDGPANTLVIRSLVDGAKDAGDLTVSVAAGTISTLTAAQITEFNTANATKFTTAAEISAFVAAEIGALNAGVDYDTAMANNLANHLTGAASTAIATSTIVDGTGTDTIVLSTSGIGIETVNLVDDAQKDVIFNIQHATINGVHAEDLLVTAEGTSYTFAQLKTAGFGTVSADGLTINNVVFDNGIPGGGGGAGYNLITLVPGTTAPATAPILATAAADLFSLDVVAAKLETLDTQINVSGFESTGAAADKLQLDLAVAQPAITNLAALDAASTEIKAFYNAIDNLIDINFGPDANGDVISVTLLGVSDASLVAVSVI